VHPPDTTNPNKVASKTKKPQLLYTSEQDCREDLHRLWQLEDYDGVVKRAVTMVKDRLLTENLITEQQAEV
jgi:hypothetical protein